MGAQRSSPAAGMSEALPLRARAAWRAFAVAIATLIVALSAQVVVPVPFSPVPMTLQPLAVLAVGGLLGAAAGASALSLYLVLGLLGLPVFAGGSAGIVHLLGPTGGYLLAFPVAAALAGSLPSHRQTAPVWVLLACAAGMFVIHAGGVAHLALLGGAPLLAFRVGFIPFLTGDLVKVGLAAAVILAVGGRLRAHR
ncbi:MAG: biotin transporter BioY [Gemmatimonadales bacterium]|nr:biotin transporter BioY [Gemmatimonadales bacterium]